MFNTFLSPKRKTLATALVLISSILSTTAFAGPTLDKITQRG